MTNTSVTYYSEPRNIDYIMPMVRLRFGDITGATYSDTMIRSAIIYGIEYLQHRWSAKYQIYQNDMLVSPQPTTIPAGYVQVRTVHGLGNVPAGLSDGDVFRNPYVTFDVDSPPIISPIDVHAIVLAAKYMLRNAQAASSLGTFISWKTEDLSYTNLGAEKSLARLLETDLKELDDYFKAKLGKPVIVTFSRV